MSTQNQAGEAMARESHMAIALSSTQTFSAPGSGRSQEKENKECIHKYQIFLVGLG